MKGSEKHYMGSTRTESTLDENRFGTTSRELPDGPIIDLSEPKKVRLFRLPTLDYYIIKSFLKAYIICAVSFTGLYIAVEIFTKIHRFIPPGNSGFFDVALQFVENIVMYHLAMVPTIYVNYMGPILTLSASMFSLTFLNRGQEFVPIKAAGVSIYRVLVPIFLLAFFFCGLTFVLQEWAIPELREPIRKALAVSRKGSLSPSPFYDPTHGLHIRVQRYSPDRKVAFGVTVEREWSFKSNQNTESSTPRNFVIDAQELEWKPAEDSTARNEKGSWILKKGRIQRWEGVWQGDLLASESEDKSMRLQPSFETRTLETSLLPIDLETSDQDISYLSWRELKNQFQRQPYHTHLRARLHQHFAFPLSHIILLLLGIPFVLNTRTKSFFLSLTISFFLCTAYFLLSSMGLNLASDPGYTKASPIIISWLPNIIFGSLGLTIFTNLKS